MFLNKFRARVVIYGICGSILLKYMYRRIREQMSERFIKSRFDILCILSLIILAKRRYNKLYGKTLLKHAYDIDRSTHLYEDVPLDVSGKLHSLLLITNLEIEDIREIHTHAIRISFGDIHTHFCVLLDNKKMINDILEISLSRLYKSRNRSGRVVFY